MISDLIQYSEITDYFKSREISNQRAALMYIFKDKNHFTKYSTFIFNEESI